MSRLVSGQLGPSNRPLFQQLFYLSLKCSNMRIQLSLLFFLIFTQCMMSCEPTVPEEGDTAVIHPDIWPETDGGIPIDPEIEARVDEILATLTTEEKVGQTIQADINSTTPEDVRQYRLGSVLNGGNSAPDKDVRSAPEKWLALVDAFWEASMDSTNGRKPIPLLWGTDAVHGHNNIPGATFFPHNIGLGATRNPELIRKIGTVTAREVLVTGMDWTFAPTLAVVRDDRWGRTYEGYSEDPEIVAQYAPAMVEGLQGKAGTNDFLSDEHVLATAKHFLGDGGTVKGKDQGDNVDTEEDFRDIHGAGYPPAVEAGTQTVMASFSSWHGKKMHGSEPLLTDVLKGRMNFNGFVVGDWNGHGQLPGADNGNSPGAMLAGLDMYMAPDSWKDLYENTLAQVKSGEIPMERLDDAVRRILRVKIRLGLFEKPRPSERKYAGQFEMLGSEQHLEVARQAVRESLVMLKNNGGILPLQANQTILVTGDGADNIGKQSGGWSLSWQGTGNTKADFPNGTTIWDGIRNAVEAGGGIALLSADGSYEEKPDVAVVVFGEDPYAEFMGDRENLDFESEDGLNLLKSLQAEGIPTVSLFLSGRPMWVNPEINASDAFVATWLPGSQGGAVADVLVTRPDGKIYYPITGKLSFSWPKTAGQTPLNRGDENYDPLFPYGYGLTYDGESELAQLSEDPDLQMDAGSQNVFFTSGKGAGVWRLQGIAEGTAILVVDALTQVGEALTIRSLDRKAQEDAKQAVWSGTSPAQFAIIGPATDFSRQSNGDMALTFEFRVDESPEKPVALFVDSETSGRSELDITSILKEAPLGSWVRADIKLSCFAKAGADMSNLASIFGISTEGALTMSFSDIRLESNEGQAICP